MKPPAEFEYGQGLLRLNSDCRQPGWQLSNSPLVRATADEKSSPRSLSSNNPCATDIDLLSHIQQQLATRSKSPPPEHSLDDVAATLAQTFFQIASSAEENGSLFRRINNVLESSQNQVFSYEPEAFARPEKTSLDDFLLMALGGSNTDGSMIDKVNDPQNAMNADLSRILAEAFWNPFDLKTEEGQSNSKKNLGVLGNDVRPAAEQDGRSETKARVKAKGRCEAQSRVQQKGQYAPELSIQLQGRNNNEPLVHQPQSRATEPGSSRKGRDESKQNNQSEKHAKDESVGQQEAHGEAESLPTDSLVQQKGRSETKSQVRQKEVSESELRTRRKGRIKNEVKGPQKARSRTEQQIQHIEHHMQVPPKECSGGQAQIPGKEANKDVEQKERIPAKAPEQKRRRESEKERTSSHTCHRSVSSKEGIYNFDAILFTEKDRGTLAYREQFGITSRGAVEYCCSYPGVSWNTRMQSWLVYYEDADGRKSRTFNPKRLAFSQLEHLPPWLRKQYDEKPVEVAMHCACTFASQARLESRLRKSMILNQSGRGMPTKDILNGEPLNTAMQIKEPSVGCVKVEGTLGIPLISQSKVVGSISPVPWGSDKVGSVIETPMLPFGHSDAFIYQPPLPVEPLCFEEKRIFNPLRLVSNDSIVSSPKLLLPGNLSPSTPHTLSTTASLSSPIGTGEAFVKDVPSRVVATNLSCSDPRICPSAPAIEERGKRLRDSSAPIENANPPRKRLQTELEDTSMESCDHVLLTGVKSLIATVQNSGLVRSENASWIVKQVCKESPSPSSIVPLPCPNQSNAGRLSEKCRTEKPETPGDEFVSHDMQKKNKGKRSRKKLLMS